MEIGQCERWNSDLHWGLHMLRFYTLVACLVALLITGLTGSVRVCFRNLLSKDNEFGCFTLHCLTDEECKGAGSLLRDASQRS